MKSNNIELDKKLLSYALQNKKFAVDLGNTTKPEYFDANISWLYKILFKHFNNPSFKEIPNENIIVDYMEKGMYEGGDIEKGKSLYKELIATSNDPAEFTWHLSKLKTRYNDFINNEALNKIKSLSTLAEEDRVNTVNKLLRETATVVDSIYKESVNNEGLLSTSAIDRWNDYKYREAHPDAARGILTGFREFDRSTNGLHPGELSIIVANTGGGKSVFMQNVGINAWLGNNSLDTLPENIDDSGKNILYFSLEMPKISMERRIDACLCELYYGQIRDGKLDETSKKRYAKGLKFQSSYKKNFYVVDLPTGCTMRDIEVKYLEIKENIFSPDIVIIDYLGIMSTSDGDSDWLQLGEVSREMHEFARTHEVVVMTAVQANRPSKDGKAKYGTDRVGRSDLITHHANVIMQIEKRDDEDFRMDMNVHLIKVRDGARGMFTLYKDFAKMKLKDMNSETYDASADDGGI